MNASRLLEEGHRVLSMVPHGAVVPGILAGYMLLVRVLRYRRVKKLHQEFHYPTRESMARMTDDEAWKIITILAQKEFPFIYLKALQFALFRTYGIPTISKLLSRTSEFSDKKTAMKRYADTGALLGEFVGHAPNTSRSHEGIARMNYIHSVYRKSGKILDDDMLYTLSLFALEPMRWINRYEWRQLTDLEKCAIGTFWKSAGDSMEISYEKLPSYQKGFKDGLEWLQELEAWSVAYEKEHMVPSEPNFKVAEETISILVMTAPKSLQGFGRKMIHCLMDDRLRVAMGCEKPGRLYRFIQSQIFMTRKLLLRYFALPRPSFLKMKRVTGDPDEPSPHYFLIWEGAPFYVKPTVWNRWGPSAWMARFLGLALPGDEGYYPEGYDTPNVGPRALVGKGGDYYRDTLDRLKIERTGQCPFAVAK